MREVLMFTDAVKGSPVGGMGVVMLLPGTDIRYEYSSPTPPALNQAQAEMYAILAGIGQVDAVLSSHGIQLKDVFLRVFTDCEEAVHAITFSEKVRNKTTRLLIKRIVRALTKKHFCPKGGGAAYYAMSDKLEEFDVVTLKEYMSRAHELSRIARSQFSNLL